MRRIELAPGQVFEEKMLNRVGAFNADALVAATNIVEDVRKRGDEALREYTAKFDGVEMEEFRVSQEAIDEAIAKVDPKVAAAIQKAASQIRDFHERQKQQGWFTMREDGALVGAKVEPLDSVGIYVPGGRALYPSSVLMNAIPASVAGVKRIVCVTPPTKDGSLDSAILEACRVAGVTEIYAVGGAQAIGALAYGTKSIKPVDKITGPGNAFVAAAKKLVSGDVGIDMIAGPSEVCVVADETALPELVAIDLMAQAEHDPLASCYLVTFSSEYADAVEAAIEKQIAMGKLTARDRILSLLDKNSFHEYDLFVKHDGRDFGMDKKDLPGDGVVTGTGTIFGAPVCIYAQDFTVAGGSLGLQHARKITKIMDHALKMKCPIIGINDSGGARIQEGVGALAGYGEIFYRNTIASGVIPQISLILGPCAGGAVYSPALTDFVFVVENISKMFITGPNVIKTVLGEDISMEDLGGARVHAETTGNAHFYAQSEQECFEQVKRLVSFIPWNNQERAKVVESKEPAAVMNIEDVVPADPKQPYDVRNVIKCIVDDSDFLEVQELWAANIVIGFGRMGGETVGFVANQPMVLAGVLDCDSADKAARFIRFCDSFNIPIITLEDMPGYLPGVDQEHAGVIRHGAKVLYAYSEATVPKITVILRKAYGGGYIAMNSRHLGADFMFAWPSAEIAVMGPEGAANIIFRKEIMEAEDQNAMRQEKVKEYIEKFANPYVAASKGFIDSVIEPKETRSLLLHALKLSVLKEEYRPAKKHGLPPF